MAVVFNPVSDLSLDLHLLLDQHVTVLVGRREGDNKEFIISSHLGMQKPSSGHSYIYLIGASNDS